MKRFKELNVLLRLLQAQWVSIHYWFGRISTSSGTLHAALDSDASVAYIREVVDDYLAYGRMSSVSGKVAEVGPGDNFGVALWLGALGAAQVDLVDRFYARREASHQAAIYEKLARLEPALVRMLKGVDFQDERTFPGIQRFYGPEAAAEAFFKTHRGYSLIVSRAVLEHCADPLSALTDMLEALVPGGLLLHKVDLRDHGLFSPPHGELEWLTTPQRLHRWMTRPAGLPNRVLLDQYREWATHSGASCDLLVTSLAGVGELRPHLPLDQVAGADLDRARAVVRQVKPRLASHLKSVAEENLAVNGVFLIVRKAGAIAPA